MPKKRKAKTKKAMMSNRDLKVYIVILAIITLLLGAHILYNIYFLPRSGSGSPIYGNRLDYIEEIPNEIITATEEFGLGQGRVEEVSVTPIGKVVYFDVRVAPGTDLIAARTQTEEIANFFLTQAGAVAEGYSLQLVVATGDIEELRDSNRAEVEKHVSLNVIRLLEEVTAHAELFPTHKNITRITENVHVYRHALGPELADEFRARADALEPLTEEEEAILIEQNQGESLELDLDRSVPISNISQFPSWGVFDTTTGEIKWN